MNKLTNKQIRKIAIAWFNTLMDSISDYDAITNCGIGINNTNICTNYTKEGVVAKYYVLGKLPHSSWEHITGREIEIIWKHKHGLD